MNRAKIYHNSRDNDDFRSCLCDRAYHAIQEWNNRGIWPIVEDAYGYDEVTDQCEQSHAIIDATYPRLNENLQTYSIPTTS